MASSLTGAQHPRRASRSASPGRQPRSIMPEPVAQQKAWELAAPSQGCELEMEIKGHPFGQSLEGYSGLGRDLAASAVITW